MVIQNLKLDLTKMLKIDIGEISANYQHMAGYDKERFERIDEFAKNHLSSFLIASVVAKVVLVLINILSTDLLLYACI